MRGLAHGVHGEGRKQERQHAANKQANQRGGVGDGKVQRKVRVQRLHLVDIRDNQRQGRQRGRANGKALARGGRGVAQRIQRVGALAHLGGHVRHFGNAARVVGHRAIGVGGQRDAQGGKHAHGRHAHAVQAHTEAFGAARKEIAYQHADAHNDNGRHGRKHAQRKPADDDGGAARLAGGGQALRGLISIGGIIFGDGTNGNAGHKAAEHRHKHAHVLRQKQADGHKGTHHKQRGADVGARAQRAQQVSLRGALFCFYKEGAHHAAQNAQRRQHHGHAHALHAIARGHGQRNGGNNRAHIAFIQIGAHAGHVAHVVAHVVGNDGGVARVILGNAGLHLAHKVGPHVGGLGEDAAHARKQRHAGGAHAKRKHVGRNGAGQLGRGHGADDRVEEFQKEIPHG